MEVLMRIGLIGLGKMGSNLALNLKDHYREIIGFDMSEKIQDDMKSQGVQVASTITELIGALSKPRVIWLMLPCGTPTDETITTLSQKLQKGDIVIDGGNSKYMDSIHHSEILHEKGIYFLDCGTSGGVRGARYGACMMIGGDKEAYQYLEEIFKDLTVDGGLLYTGRAGSGHFMKMVHNAIEYGMMEAIGEGFQLLKESEFDYDLSKVAYNWNHGSVIRSWLMEIVQEQFEKDHNLEDILGVVHTNGEAKWAVETALEKEVPMPAIVLSLMVRNASKDNEKFACKIVAAMRNGFGGHALETKE